VVDIFDEVEEDLRAERAQRLVKQYGGLIVGLALLIVLAAAGWQVWGWWQAKQDMAAASAYMRAMSLADRAGPGAQQQPPEAAAAFAALASRAPDGYATLARLREAALKADAGDLAGAAALWDQVAADTSADPLLRDLASLLWARRQLDKADPSLLEARLRALTAPDNPWRPLAEEAEGLLDIRSGKTDAAKAIFRRLAEDPAAPEGVRGRASGLLARLGE
jgi:hypothetical protein